MASPEKSEAAFPSPSAREYALAVFGTVVYGEVTLEPPEQQISSGVKPKDPVTNGQYKKAMDKVISILKKYNMDADVCHRAFTASNLKHKIDRPKKEKGRACRFFCTHCQNKGIASLIAAGEFITDLNGNGLKMNYLFPHNSNCQSAQPTAPQSRFTLVNFDFDAVIGTTYSAATDEVNKQKVTEKRTTDEVVKKQKVTRKKRKIRNTIGKFINFDDTTHCSDDRAYCDLPGDNVDDTAHKNCMIRLLLHMSVTLNFVEETVTELFDWSNVRSRIDDCNNKSDTNWTDYPRMSNPNAHLYFCEISLLFGGHNMNEGEPEHQRCHMDVTGLGRPDALKAFHGLSKPGSIIAPLDDERTIYVGYRESPDREDITVKKGQYIHFFGDVAHGGWTYEEQSWHAAIHLHVDSIHHKRKEGFVEIADCEEEATQRLNTHFQGLKDVMSGANKNGYERCIAEGKTLARALFGKLLQKTGKRK
jgi:hypothetical protein